MRGQSAGGDPAVQSAQQHSSYLPLESSWTEVMSSTADGLRVL